MSGRTVQYIHRGLCPRAGPSATCWRHVIGSRLHELASRTASAARWFSAEAAIAAVPAVDAANANTLYDKAVALIEAMKTDEQPETVSAARDALVAAANTGHIAAVGRLGRWHLFGLYGIPRDLRKALALLQTSASADDVEASYWLGHALGKLDDLAAQEQALQAAVQAARGAAQPQGNGSDMIAPVAPSSPAAASFPDPTRDETEDEASARVARAQAVILDIRAQRKKNAQAKAQGKAKAGELKDGSGAPTAPTTGSFDPATLPLRSHPALAYAWLLKAAAADHADSLVALGNICMAWEGQGAGPDKVKEAMQWYELAARLPSSDAPDGQGVTPGHRDAQYNLGMIYWEGVEGVVDKDYTRALLAFEAAAGQGDSSALMFLGHLYRTGDANAAVRPNARKALRYLETACANGHGGAAHYLAQLWRDGDGSVGIIKDERRARYFLGLACEADVPEAWAEHGDLFLHGDGKGQGVDLPAALHSYERAGSLGHASALVSAGAMHYQGLGCPVDHVTAAERYRAAGELGSPEGWDNLAALHAKGEGVPQSVQAARSYAQLAERLRQLRKQDEQGASAGSCGSEAPTTSGGGCGKSTCGCKSSNG